MTLDRWSIPHFKDEKEISFELDHVLPRYKKGKTDANNLVLSCRSCNRTRKRITENLQSSSSNLKEKYDPLPTSQAP